jgi:hypothetical protein
MKKRNLFLSFLVLLALPAIVLGRNDTVAVLTSDMAPYQEAFAGFQEELGQPVDVIRLTDGPLHIQGQPRIVVAFGGKAVHQKYSDGSILIYCMAPGTFVSINDHSGLSVQISMMPEPAVLLSKLKEVQPALKRLAVLWSSPAFEVYAQKASREGPGIGVQIRAERLTKPEELPARLRDLKGQVDALWLPPDPLLINSADIVIMTQFAWLNNVPLYTAVAGLNEQGAVAAVSSTYREIGRAAGRAARQALSGGVLPNEFYPNTVELTVNRQSAMKAGMELPKVIPDETPRASP